MIPKILLILTASSILACAGESTPDEHLRQGLFEEEANHDLAKATEHYRAVTDGFERQRTMAATAWFRLGEIARKKNDKEAAATAFRTVAERFPDLTDLARLSRENLGALGVAVPDPTGPAVPNVANGTTGADEEASEISRLEALARSSPDLINGADTEGWKPIHHAAAKGQVKVIQYLLEHKADANAEITGAQTRPLHLATLHGHLAAVQALLAAKADLDASMNAEDAPDPVRAFNGKVKEVGGSFRALDLAILYQRPAIATALIKAGADLVKTGPYLTPDPSRGYVPTSSGQDRRLSGPSFHATPLHLALFLHQDDMVKELLAAKAPLGASPYDAWPIAPLNFAVLWHREMVPVLLKAGADPKVGIPESGTTPLHDAAQCGDVESAKLLCEAGADPKATDKNGRTPLHYARSPEVVDLLASKGVDNNARDGKGDTPLVLAVSNRDTKPETVEALLRHGAKAEDPDKLLQLARLGNNLPVVLKQVVLPAKSRPDAIQVYVQGNQSTQITDLRLVPEMKPPTLCDVLAEQEGTEQRRFRIIRYSVFRRGEDGQFQELFPWHIDNGAPTDPLPLLAWGDLVRVERVQAVLLKAESANGDRLKFPEFQKQEQPIPVTYRLAGHPFPVQLSSGARIKPEGQFHGPLDPIAINAYHRLPFFADQSKVQVWRKGLPKPILLDFSKIELTGFRPVTDDVIDIALAPQALGAKEFLLTVGSLEDGRLRQNGGLLETLDCTMDPNLDWSAVRIIRHGNPNQTETVDLLKWAANLPPREKWNIGEMARSDRRVEAGDIVVVPRLQNPPPGPPNPNLLILEQACRLLFEHGRK